MSIYLDNSATTPMCEEALSAYLHAAKTAWGNPSSRHLMGKEAEDILKTTRAKVLSSLGTREGTVIFTAGGTEANNLAIFGRAYAKPRYRRGGKILTTAGEHSSVTECLSALRAEGFEVVEIPTAGGSIDMATLEKELTPNVILLTMMLVNNETGAVYDLAAVSRLAKQKCPDACLHADATQAYLKLPVSPRALGADMITVSAHKIEGPKGVGALWVSPAVIKNRGIVARELGGGQEGGWRSGTENVPAIAAFGAAIDKQTADRADRVSHMLRLRQRLLDGVASIPALAEVKCNLPPVCAPHIVSITLPRIKSETMLHFLSARGIFVSSGSACSSHDTHTSPAMIAFGLSQAEADSTLRVSFGIQNTDADVDAFLSALSEGVGSLIRFR